MSLVIAVVILWPDVDKANGQRVAAPGCASFGGGICSACARGAARRPQLCREAKGAGGSSPRITCRRDTFKIRFLPISLLTVSLLTVSLLTVSLLTVSLLTVSLLTVPAPLATKLGDETLATKIRPEKPEFPNLEFPNLDISTDRETFWSN